MNRKDFRPDYSNEIREEHKASTEYKQLAKKHPKDARKLTEIANDEKQHAKELKKLEYKNTEKYLAKNSETSKATYNDNLDYQDYVEYSNANKKYVKIKRGYGDYEYKKYSEIVKEDGSSGNTPIERNVLGYPVLYNENGTIAYGFNRPHHSNNKVEKVLSEYKHGKLKSSSGKKVTKRKQAVAIALSEQRRSKQIYTDYKGRKYKIVKGQYIYLTKKGKPKYWSKKEMKELGFET